MFSLDYAYEVERQRRQDEMEMVRHDRRLREAMDPGPVSAGRYQRMVIWIGKIMVAWGSRLKSHYEGLRAAGMEPRPLPPEPDPC